MTNEEILQAFYQEYWRSPSIAEFKACGGKMAEVRKNYGGYRKMLVKLKYDPFAVGESIELIEDGEVVFTGVAKEVAEEIGCSDPTLSTALKNNRPVHGYEVRVKPFKGLTKGEKQ